ncbi:MAG: hypothetical protein AAF492_09180, partial [Verrucomicrobiota bacterium]
MKRGLALLLVFAAGMFPVRAALIDACRFNDVIYFLQNAPDRIERFDLNTETWQPTIALSDVVRSIAVDASGIYVGFRSDVIRMSFDGTVQIPLATVSPDILEVHVAPNFLFINHSDSGDAHYQTRSKISGALIDSDSWYRGFHGTDFSSEVGRILGRTLSSSSPNIASTTVDAQGMMSSTRESSYGRYYPNASEVYFFPDGSNVVDSAGTIHNALDLTWGGSLGGAVDDIAFHADRPVVVRDGAIVAFSSHLAQTGSYTPTNAPAKIFVHNDQVYSFYHGGPHGLSLEKIPFSLMTPDVPGAPVDPSSVSFLPDQVEVGADGIVYLLSRAHRNIFRWSTDNRDYLTSIPLLGEPTVMTYSPTLNRLYLGYEPGTITRIEAGDPLLREEIFAHISETPREFAAADDVLFVMDFAGSSTSLHTFDAEGALLDHVERSRCSPEYIWSPVNQRIYHTGTYALDQFVSEIINPDGTIGPRMDSPRHSSIGIRHPIRVHPDGSYVIHASGWIFDAITLDHIATLPQIFDDAVFSGGELFTVRSSAAGGTILEGWSATQTVVHTKVFAGEAIRLLDVDEGIVMVLDDGGETEILLINEQGTLIGSGREFISVFAEAEPRLGLRNETVTYSVTVTNHSSTNVSGLTIFHQLPPGVSPLGPVTAAPGVLPAGASTTVQLDVMVLPSATN